MNLHNASPIEIAWTLIAVCGFVVQAMLLRDAWRDRQIARALRAGNARRGRLIWGHIRSGAVFLMIHALFVLAGVNAMLNPNPVGGEDVSIRRTITIAALIAAAVLLVLVGVADQRDRVLLRRPNGPPEDPPRDGER